MIYLDNGATSLHKPPAVRQAMVRAMQRCANPGRGGHAAAMNAAQTVYHCRETAAHLFHCDPEQIVFTSNCTHGLNIAIRTLVKPGARVLISGFEHNAVTRPLHALDAQTVIAGDRLFDTDALLSQFEDALKSGVDAAVFTHMSNVFGYILPVGEMARLCRHYRVPFAVDAAQSAGALEIRPDIWQADFVAMPGHKGLLGPQGTGVLVCRRTPQVLLYGGTGSQSLLQEMPDDLPDRLEAGTLNVPGIAGLDAGMRYVNQIGTDRLLRREQLQVAACAKGLKNLGFRVFDGAPQGGTLSFIPPLDCELAAERLAQRGVAVRAGLHCAPLAHRTVGTLETGTVRVSFGHDACAEQTAALLAAAHDLR